MALLRDRHRPTAIFAGSDLRAMGVYEAARQLGLSIPGDPSVIGFDDLPVARWIGPPLTTIRQPLREMAEAAARFVISLGSSSASARHQPRQGREARATAHRPRHQPHREGQYGCTCGLKSSATPHVVVIARPAPIYSGRRSWFGPSSWRFEARGNPV
jgi:hypothetical protein